MRSSRRAGPGGPVTGGAPWAATGARCAEPPRGFEDWLSTLGERGLGARFDPQIAAAIRVLAASRTGGAVLCTGTGPLPYVDWLQDGMSMSSRMIVHLAEPETAGFIRTRYATDIRVATHLQDLTGFLSDVGEHRFDIALIDADEVDDAQMRALADQMTDHGVLLVLGGPVELGPLTAETRETHFRCRFGGPLGCVAVVRKGLQHRKSRRGGRRRPRSPTVE